MGWVIAGWALALVAGVPLGGLILLYGLGVAVMSTNGWVIDRIGKARAVPLTLLCLTALFAALPFTVAAPVALGVVLSLMGTQQAGFLTAAATLATNAMPALRGAVVALMSSTTYIGVMMGAAVMGPVFEGPGFGAIGLACAAIALTAAGLSVRLHAAAPLDRASGAP